MALVGDKTALSGISDFRKDKTEEKENLWTKILGEVQSGDTNKLSTAQSLIVLGDNESGKTTLVAKLQGNEDPKKGSGLEYVYIDVRDEYRDDHTRLGVWILDGDPKHSQLLEFALNEKNCDSTLAVLCVSMTSPWAIMDQLHTWASALQDHMDKLQLDPDYVKNQRNIMIKLWQDYTEPGDELEANGQMKRSSRNLEADDDAILPLPDSVLTRNLGIHLIVVVTKTDYMSTLEKDFDYKEEHFEFIQQSIRKFCLHYGASLFYTSVKEDKNCDLLYKYLVHRIYGFPFKTPALVVEKDAVFIPAGWDNEKKIAILYENMHTIDPEAYYTDVIVKPQVARKTTAREVEVQAEDENAFLARHLAQLQAGGAIPPGSSNRQESPMRPPSATQRAAERRGVNTSPAANQIGSPKKMETTKPGATAANEGILANFFNALLTKKPVTTPVAGTNRVQSVDAAAELDRMTRGISGTSPSVNLNNSTNPSSEQNSIENNNSLNTSSEC